MENNSNYYQFPSGEAKVAQFKKELKELLSKFDAELLVEDFGRDWSPDDKMVANFNWDADLGKRTGNGNVDSWVIGRWEGGE